MIKCKSYFGTVRILSIGQVHVYCERGKGHGKKHGAAPYGQLVQWEGPYVKYDPDEELRKTMAKLQAELAELASGTDRTLRDARDRLENEPVIGATCSTCGSTTFPTYPKRRLVSLGGQVVGGYCVDVYGCANRKFKAERAALPWWKRMFVW